jgi:hypothetical protein
MMKKMKTMTTTMMMMTLSVLVLKMLNSKTELTLLLRPSFLQFQ